MNPKIEPQRNRAHRENQPRRKNQQLPRAKPIFYFPPHCPTIARISSHAAKNSITKTRKNGITKSGVASQSLSQKGRIREGEAPAEPVFTGLTARQEPRPPSLGQTL